MAYDANVPANDLTIASIPSAIRTKGADVKALLDAHTADTSAAHAASAISNTASGGISATNVQSAINELDTEKAPKASPTFTGTVSGISATMISNTPAGNIAATNVQTALNELDTEKIAHALATATNDFLVASGVGAFVKKTLAETKTILGISNVTNDAQVKKIASSVDNQVARWNGTSGDLLQGSLMTIDDNGSPNIPTGQSYKINGTALSATNVGALPSTYLDTDGTLTANSDVKVPSQKAVKTYVDSKDYDPPVGSVLRVFQAQKTDTFVQASDSFIDITGLSYTITPLSSSNKILISFSVHTGDSDSGKTTNLRIVRGATAIGVGDAAGNRFTAFTGIRDITPGTSLSGQWLDSPATTSAITYKIQARSIEGGTIYVNRGGNDWDGDSTSTGRYVSTMTIMEIKG